LLGGRGGSVGWDLNRISELMVMPCLPMNLKENKKKVLKLKLKNKRKIQQGLILNSYLQNISTFRKLFKRTQKSISQKFGNSHNGS
jgi:hypothetical protein